MDCNQIIDVDGPGTSYMEASILIVSPELLPSQTRKSEQTLKKQQIDIRRELDIDFVDEDRIDAKGLTREYLNLVLQGEYLNLVLQGITDGTGSYILFEVAISPALTVVQGGSGLVGLSRAFSPYLVTRDITSSLTISDIPDLTVQMCLQEVK
ncbi:unnamed protein product, partial [Porites evermanni]